MTAIYKRYIVRVAMAWLGCAAVFTLAYLLILLPQHKAGEKLEKEVEQKKMDYQAVQLIAQEETKDKMRQELDELRKHLGQFVLDFGNTANLTLDLSQLAGQNNLQSFGIASRENRTNQASSTCSYITENHLDVRFDSDFNRFAFFLSAIERYRPTVFVDTFSISRPKETGREPEVNMDLALLVKKHQDNL